MRDYDDYLTLWTVVTELSLEEMVENTSGVCDHSALK